MNLLKDEKIDYIFCSDCLYEEAPWEKLLETLIYFSNLNSELEIIFAYKKRYIYQELFLKEIEKYFSNILDVPSEKIYYEFRNINYDFQIKIIRK